MYSPISLLELLRYRTQPLASRPVIQRDLEIAREIARAVVSERDDLAMLRQRAADLIVTTAVPAAGHLAFGWPLWLIGLAAAFDALMHGLADLIRSERAWGAVHRALFFAAQVEITLQLIQSVRNSPRPAMTCWRTDLENYPRYVGLLAAFPILVVMYLLPAALEGPGLAAVLATLVLPGVSVLWQAWRTASVKPPGERSVDMNFLPRAPTTFLLVTLAGMTGAITEGLLSIFFPGQQWFGLAVLVIWLAWSILLAAQWCRKMLKARRTLEQFLARDPERSMLFPTSKHDQQRAEQAFLAHSLEPETLWPPR